MQYAQHLPASQQHGQFNFLHARRNLHWLIASGSADLLAYKHWRELGSSPGMRGGRWSAGVTRLCGCQSPAP